MLTTPTRNVVLTGLFAALTAVGAWLVIPIQPVPFTFQVVFVLLAGVLLGSRFGALSQVVYILLGLIGLPVFAGGMSGLAALAGPTGGYLFGFVLGAYVIGKITEIAKPSFFVLVGSMVAGIAVIYLLGMVQLALVAHLSLWKAFLGGVLPFIGFDLLKAFMASTIALRLEAVGIPVRAAE